jgi:hypothetical protein
MPAASRNPRLVISRALLQRNVDLILGNYTAKREERKTHFVLSSPDIWKLFSPDSVNAITHFGDDCSP